MKTKKHSFSSLLLLTIAIILIFFFFTTTKHSTSQDPIQNNDNKIQQANLQEGDTLKDIIIDTNEDGYLTIKEIQKTKNLNQYYEKNNSQIIFKIPDLWNDNPYNIRYKLIFNPQTKEVILKDEELNLIRNTTLNISYLKGIYTVFQNDNFPFTIIFNPIRNQYYAITYHKSVISDPSLWFNESISWTNERTTSSITQDVFYIFTPSGIYTFAIHRPIPSCRQSTFFGGSYTIDLSKSYFQLEGDYLKYHYVKWFYCRRDYYNQITFENRPLIQTCFKANLIQTIDIHKIAAEGKPLLKSTSYQMYLIGNIKAAGSEYTNAVLYLKGLNKEKLEELLNNSAEIFIYTNEEEYPTGYIEIIIDLKNTITITKDNISTTDPDKITILDYTDRDKSLWRIIYELIVGEPTYLEEITLEPNQYKIGILKSDVYFTELNGYYKGTLKINKIKLYPFYDFYSTREIQFEGVLKYDNFLNQTILCAKTISE